MDPNENLCEMRALAKHMMEVVDGNATLDEATPFRLADLVLAMDHWISQGGGLPQDWRCERASTQTRYVGDRRMGTCTPCKGPVHRKVQTLCGVCFCRSMADSTKAAKEMGRS